jgi:hypothetical protein
MIKYSAEDREKVLADFEARAFLLNTKPHMWTLGKPNGNGGILFVGTLAEASEEAIKLTQEAGYLIIAYDPDPVSPCPSCGRLCGDFLLDQMGMCLHCDHVQSDI